MESEATAVLAQVPVNTELGCRGFAFESDPWAQEQGHGGEHPRRGKSTQGTVASWALQWANGGPPKTTSPSPNPLQHGNVNLFGKRVFKDVMKLRISR